MKKLLYLLLFGLLIVVASKLTMELYLNKKLKMTNEQVVTIEKGSSLTSVAGLLAQKGYIDYPRLFVKVGQFYGYSDSIKYGEYQLGPMDTYRQVLKKLVKGDVVKYRITLVEGDHIYHLAKLLSDVGLCSEQEFLQTVTDKALIESLLGEKLQSLEGYLFPETYSFSKIDGVKMIVTTMVNKFLQETANIPFAESGLSRHQVVTLASIVEKETGASFERPKIASVFHNRLNKKMRLQTDPTIIYGIMHETGKEISNIRKKDITRPTAYNTYVITGLPPGPIGNPGIEAIKAVVKPETTPYLYFVSQNDGTHIFTSTYKDHLKAVKKFQLNPKMREGKSWRDLQQKRAQ